MAERAACEVAEGEKERVLEHIFVIRAMVDPSPLTTICTYPVRSVSCLTSCLIMLHPESEPLHSKLEAVR
jgi:hypothetical protein